MNIDRKPLYWIASSKDDLQAFPTEVRRAMGFALWQAQIGRKHRDSKPLKGFSGGSVLELVEDFDGNTFRVGLHGPIRECNLRTACIPEKVEAGR